MSQLFSPFQLRDVTLTNRIVVSPMCQYSSTDGLANDWHTIHLGNLSMSGAALVFIEATAVEQDGRITPGCLGLWSDAHEAALRPAVEAARRWGTARLGIQLGHAGRKASCAVPWRGGKQLGIDDGGWDTVAPSPLAFREGERAPRELGVDDIARIRGAFVAAAQRASRLGLDVVELHCAHGYLLHEFLSPVSNHRTDGYGGTREGRMRLPLEVFQAMRDALPPSVAFGVRVSATDWIDGGWTLEDTVAFAAALRGLGCDFVDCSSGAIHPAQKLKTGPGYQVPFARQVRAQAQIPTIAVGMITEAQQANEIVESGSADLVALARGMLRDPRWGWHAAEALGERIVAPPQYLLAAPATLMPR